MIGFGVGQVDFEEMKFAIDGVDEADATVADAMNAIGRFRSGYCWRRRRAHDRGRVWFCQAALDTAAVWFRRDRIIAFTRKPFLLVVMKPGPFVGRGNERRTSSSMPKPWPTTPKRFAWRLKVSAVLSTVTLALGHLS